MSADLASWQFLAELFRQLAQAMQEGHRVSGSQVVPGDGMRIGGKKEIADWLLSLCNLLVDEF